jgi:hypothetical protein
MFPAATLFYTLHLLHEETLALRARGAQHEANHFADTLARAFFPLVSELEGQQGWLRALCILLDLATPQMLDAIALPDQSLGTVRMAAAMSIPPLTSITGAEDIRAQLQAAIQVGAPAFNRGDVQQCIIIYWTTILTIVAAPTPAGFPKMARSLRPLREIIETPLVNGGATPSAFMEGSWRLRHAIDAALAALA